MFNKIKEKQLNMYLRLIKNIFTFTLIFFLTGCYQKYIKNIKIGPKYQHDTFEGKKVGIIVYKNKISIVYSGSVENEFGKGNAKELIKNYFYTEFPKHFQDSSIFSKAYIDSCAGQCDFQSVVVRPRSRDNVEKKFYMPDSGKIIHLNRGIPDYVLILQKISIKSTPSAQVFALGFTPLVAVPTKPVTYTSGYVLWDNVMGRMAGWGNCQVSGTTGCAVTLKTWQYATGLFARRILSDERLKYPAIEYFEIGPVEESVSISENIAGCWYYSKSKTKEPIAIKSRDNKQMLMNINGKTLFFDLDTANSSKKEIGQLHYQDFITESYIIKYGNVKLEKRIKDPCKYSKSNPRMMHYTGNLILTYAGKRKMIKIRGSDICE